MGMEDGELLEGSFNVAGPLLLTRQAFLGYYVLFILPRDISYVPLALTLIGSPSVRIPSILRLPSYSNYTCVTRECDECDDKM
jgi:hypothetical protein